MNRLPWKMEPNTTELGMRYRAVRSNTCRLAAGLSPEDQMVQSFPDASPVKWHQAHTTWFFETFVLIPLLGGYQPFRAEFRWFFNSYYNSLGEKAPLKPVRGVMSRPSLDEVLAYRSYVDEAIDELLRSPVPDDATRRIVLGINHEQQHQELMLTDIKHAFFTNPLRPPYDDAPCLDECPLSCSDVEWLRFSGGMTEIGYPLDRANAFDFCFDNETPRHKTYIEPFEIANRPTTCREYLEFMLDRGYARPEFWLSEGWDTVQRERWHAPLYWDCDRNDVEWRVFTLHGWRPLSLLLDTPVCHVSFFEADAFARWRGLRMPTEAEWEFAAAGAPVRGNLLESGRLHPAIARDRGLEQLFGDCWEWTASPYTGYPGYKPLPGALGEYNGKFMSSQMVLRGGSCVSPESHIRSTYRNFFPPETRWQFSGIRLAT